MTQELTNQIKAMVEDYCTEFMDAYQCMNWGVSAREFADILVKKFTIVVAEYAEELDEEEN